MFLIASLVLLKISAGQGNVCLASPEEITNFKLILDKYPDILEQIWCNYQKTFTQLNLKILSLAEAPERPFVLPSDPETSYKSLLLTSFEVFLKSNLKSNDQRYRAFMKIFNLRLTRNIKIIVETGTSRKCTKNCESSIMSTPILSILCMISDTTFYSVDNLPEAFNEKTDAIKDFSEYVNIITSDSVEYLKKFDKGLIDLLYLNSFDFNAPHPKHSEKYHKKEIEAAYDKLHKKSIVVIDDCNLDYGRNCWLVEDFLLNQGWMLLVDDHQKIFVYDLQTI